MKKMILVVSVVLVLSLGIFIVGCSREGITPEGKTKLAFVTNNTANFWVFARRGCEKAAGEMPDFEVDFRLSAEPTSAEQRRIIDDRRF